MDFSGAGLQAQVRSRPAGRRRTIRSARGRDRQPSRNFSRSSDASTTTSSSTPARDQFVLRGRPLCGRHDLPGRQPRRAFIRNAQRLVDRVRQLGAGGEREQDSAESRPPEHHPVEANRDSARPWDSSHLRERLPSGFDGIEFRRAAGTEQRLRNRQAIRQFTQSAITPETPVPEKRLAFLGLLRSSPSHDFSLNYDDQRRAVGRGRRSDAPRRQYVELKANVHRKLLGRLNLEALASAERTRAEAEIRTLLFELMSEEGRRSA